MSTSYTVYRVSYVGLPRDHHAIFVEERDDLSGHIYQVSGTIQSGMYFEDKCKEAGRVGIIPE